MYKLVILLFLFGCQNSVSEIKRTTVNYNEVSINVVEKVCIKVLKYISKTASAFKNAA